MPRVWIVPPRLSTGQIGVNQVNPRLGVKRDGAVDDAGGQKISIRDDAGRRRGMGCRGARGAAGQQEAEKKAPPAPNSGGAEQERKEGAASKEGAMPEEGAINRAPTGASSPAPPEAAERSNERAAEYDTPPPAPNSGGAGVARQEGAASKEGAINRAPTGASAPTPPELGAGGPTRPEERIRMTRRRQTIASRLVEAQHTAAMLTTFNEIDMSAVMAIRAKRKESFTKQFGIGLGFMSFFTKASIGALKAYPLLNAEIQGLEIVKKGYYDIGIAVGAEEGLVVPVVRDADKKTFAGIEKDIADLAKRARENTLTLPELQGGTFTITNGGVFGSMLSTPILNGPQVGILGLHKIEQRPIALSGEVVIRPMMYVALSYDHRIVDGSEAVKFLVKIKELIEDPEALLLEG